MLMGLRMATKKKNIFHMIDILADATGCDDWANDVREKLISCKGSDIDASKSAQEQRKCIQYIWPFYDISRGFIYSMIKGELQNVPWIQKKMTHARLEKIIQRSKEFKANSNPTFQIGTKTLDEETEFDDEGNLNGFYDAYDETISWSVLQLFVHRTIRKVGKGADENNKYCFWPLSQPWVNHRPIEVKLLNQKEGYIERLSTSTSLVWGSQKALTMPYAVSTRKVKGDKKIEMTFMINSGESKTNSEVYVEETDFNKAAGNLHCVGMTCEDLDTCIDALTVRTNK
jgi:hypothetical protein